jgi:hypothetical protein
VAEETFLCGRDVCVRPAVFGGDDILLFVHRVSEEGVEAPMTVAAWPALLRFDERGLPRAMMHPAITRRTAGEPLLQAEVCVESRETLVRLLPRRGEDMVLSATLAAAEAQRVGLLFRTSITGRDNNTVWLDLEKREVSLHKGVGGMPLLSASCQGIGEPEVRLTVAAVGRLVVVYVNDVLILSGPVATRHSGGIGLAVDRGRAEFRDVNLRQISMEE